MHFKQQIYNLFAAKSGSKLTFGALGFIHVFDERIQRFKPSRVKIHLVTLNVDFARQVRIAEEHC